VLTPIQPSPAAGKGYAASQQEKQRTAQAVEISADINLVRILHLLRGHVIGRAHDHALLGHGGIAILAGLLETGQPHIQDLDHPGERGV
jgi:hypothetical protein